MTRLEKGMLIRTNYSGPYRIRSVIRNCRCPVYLDTKPQPPHVHLTVTNPDGSGQHWLNHFVEETLLSLEKTYCGFKIQPDFDCITAMPNDKPVQLSMF